MTSKFENNSTISVVDSAGRILARIFMATPCGNSASRRVKQTDARSLIEALRKVPRRLMHVDVQYPLLGTHIYQLNELKGATQMDLAKVVKNREERQARVEEKERRRVYVAPAPETLPDDGVLAYHVVSAVFDIANVPAHAVALFDSRDFEALKLITENQVLFDIEAVSLLGLPGAEYSVPYTEATWPLERAAYATLVNDIRTGIDIERGIAAQNATKSDVHQANSTNSAGRVKEFASFVGSDDDSIADDAIKI